MTMHATRWVDVAERLPTTEGKYIVETVGTHRLYAQKQRLEARFNPTASGGGFDVHNQRVTRWLEEPKEVTRWLEEPKEKSTAAVLLVVQQAIAAMEPVLDLPGPLGQGFRQGRFKGATRLVLDLPGPLELPTDKGALSESLSRFEGATRLLLSLDNGVLMIEAIC
jgi:hypothetical protein